jgi:hypothetical protein
VNIVVLIILRYKANYATTPADAPHDHQNCPTQILRLNFSSTFPANHLPYIVSVAPMPSAYTTAFKDSQEEL